MRTISLLTLGAIVAGAALMSGVSVADDAKATVFEIQTDILVNRQIDDADERSRALKPRCDLWVSYLDNQAERLRGTQQSQVGIDRSSVQCVDVELDDNDDTVTAGRLIAQVRLPGNRQAKETKIATFRATNHYESWRQCHIAAGRSTALAFRCVDFGKVNGEYETELREFNQVAR